MTSDLFLSYTRIKDLYDGVSKFKEHLEWSLRLQTGNTEFSIFQDKNEILVGENFRQVIEDELSNTKGLIVVYSPTWFNSNYCRKEYNCFKKANSSRPIIVLKWGNVDVESLEDEESIKIHQELSQLNHYDWNINLQYGQWSSPELKIATANLASQIVKLLKQ